VHHTHFKKLKSLLNKLTLEKFDRLSKAIVESTEAASQCVEELSEVGIASCCFLCIFVRFFLCIFGEHCFLFLSSHISLVSSTFIVLVVFLT
jgi:hypothetical protein